MAMPVTIGWFFGKDIPSSALAAVSLAGSLDVFDELNVLTIPEDTYALSTPTVTCSLVLEAYVGITVWKRRFKDERVEVTLLSI